MRLAGAGAHGTYLDRILQHKRWRAATDRRDTGALATEAAAAPRPRGFARALTAVAEAGELEVIAEIKRRSPVKGDLAPDLEPAEMAAAYAAGGAACLSVLTDVEFFGGSFHDLADARDGAGPGIPLLRKDFTVSPNDVADTRIVGADAVLLIAAALDDAELVELLGLAIGLGLDALVEVHDEAELDRAVAAGAILVGVNQRDLETFAVDPSRAARLAPRMPDGVVRVAESGITGPDDARRLADAGYHAVLVGEALVRSADPAAAVAELRTAPVRGSPHSRRISRR
ncbi:MAG: indole-3-glycerol phosphate synthase TrpC [Acidimicrobiales bacterium]